MKSRKYLNTDALIYSCVFGSGIYSLTNHLVQDPLCGDSGSGAVSPLFRNILTGEEFFAKRINCNKKLQEQTPDWFLKQYKRLVTSPPSRVHLLCPSDLIQFSDEQADKCSLFVAQEYTDIAAPSDISAESCAVLFPYGGYPNMLNGIRKLSQLKQKNWENQEIRRMAIEIVTALEDINRSGYVYSDMHLSRFFFTEEGTVYLNFSNLLFPFQNLRSYAGDVLCEAEDNLYPIEFADPAVVQRSSRSFDFQSQNYSLCALLFYLFLGQYPYDGRLLTGYADGSIQEHYIKFRDYHKMPVFIFDPDDRRNALGAFDEEQQVIDLWNALPEPLPQMFTTVLRRENALRQTRNDNPTPSMWLQCFRELGWSKNPKENGT